MIITTERAIRVFLVDDHRTTLWGLERLITGADRMQLVGTRQASRSCSPTPKAATPT